MNNYLPHLVIVPEDEANQRIANEFLVECESPRQVLVDKPAGGRDYVVPSSDSDHAKKLRQFRNRFLLLLIDLDANLNYEQYRREIPVEFEDRIFVIGAKPEPEVLRRETGKSDRQLGEILAKECRTGTRVFWAHPLLEHNRAELARAADLLRPILFAND